MLKVRYLGTVAVVSAKFLNHPKIYIIPALKHEETLSNVFKLVLDLSKKFHKKKDDRVIDRNLGHIKLDKTSGAFHLVWCNARPKISTENIPRVYPMKHRRKKIKLLKISVCKPITRKPFRFVLAVGMTVGINCQFSRDIQ